MKKVTVTGRGPHPTYMVYDVYVSLHRKHISTILVSNAMVWRVLREASILPLNVEQH